MGAGNWTLQNDDLDYELVYVDVFGNLDDDELDIDVQATYAQEDFELYLKEILPDSFNFDIHEYHSRRGSIFSRNGLFDVILGDNESTIALCIATRYDSPNFASGRLSKFATKIFDELFWSYELFVRTGPWTSGIYIPSVFRDSDVYKESDYKYYIKLRKHPMLEVNINENDEYDITIKELKEDLKFDRKSLSIFDKGLNKFLLNEVYSYAKNRK